MTFHEVRFPTDISIGARGGPERRTEIVVLGSGHEERNTRWAHSRRKYNAGYGVKTLNDLHTVIAFFEERRGRLYGFRWRDAMDFKSSLPQDDVSATDQLLGSGDGTTDQFQLIKQYGSVYEPYNRIIHKPISASVLISVDGVLQFEGADYTLDTSTGLVTFLPGHIPASGQNVTAGFEFDVAVRFDSDQLKINMSRFHAGEIPDIPIIEIRI